MIRKNNRLLVTALGCVERGIPVCPVSSYGDQAGDWLAEQEAVAIAWDVAEPPNLGITSSETLAIWKLPRVAGAYGKRLYEQQRPGVWPPTMKLPDGDWITCTLPPDANLGPLASGVEQLASGVTVVIPPSQVSGHRLRWDGSEFPFHPLPTAAAVLSQVLQAEIEYQELHGERRA